MRTRLALLAVVFAGCDHHHATTLTSTDLRAQIQAAYDGYAHAFATNDIGGVMNALTPDVEWRLGDGTVQHRAEIEPDMARILAHVPPNAHVYFTIEKLTPITPDKVIADVVFHLDAGDRHDADAWQDTWLKGPHGWQNALGVEEPPISPP